MRGIKHAVTGLAQGLDAFRCSRPFGLETLGFQPGDVFGKASGQLGCSKQSFMGPQGQLARSKVAGDVQSLLTESLTGPHTDYHGIVASMSPFEPAAAR